MRRTVVVLILIAALGAVSWYWWRREAVPSPGSPAYEQLVANFYRGVAALDTGVLDDAVSAFERATATAPMEPAAWANLAVTQLRASRFDAAAEAIARARALAPRNASIAAIQGRLDLARGRVDAGVAALREAVMLDGADARTRFALAEALEQQGDAGLAEAQQELDELGRRLPQNTALQLERIRLAARRASRADLEGGLRGLEPNAAWPPAAVEQLSALRAAGASGDFAGAARAAAFLRNVLAPVPSYRDSLATIRLPAELIAPRLDRFVVTAVVPAEAAPRDTSLAYVEEPLGASPASAVIAWPADTDAMAIFTAGPSGVRRLDRQDVSALAQGASTLLPLDWNGDFRTDLVTTDGRTLTLLQQGADGSFVDISRESGIDAVSDAITGVWAADVDLDGDLDLVAGIESKPPLVLRNNGDGTSRALPMFEAANGVKGFAWADFDADGDPDAALLDAAGRIHVFINQQGGLFTQGPAPDVIATAIAAGDIDADGRIDLVVSAGASVRQFSIGDAGWRARDLASWDGAPGPITALVLADADNNGALDLIATTAAQSQLWLADTGGRFTRQSTMDGAVAGAVDLTGDGRLDLVAIANGRAVRYVARGERPYHWQVIRARAQTTPGDQRINSFGAGGDIEVRAGLLVQKQVLSGAPVHIGLGTRTRVDVARITWPNGVVQSEFDLGADRTVVAQQRLKGSCPWVFADNGTEMAFVTDFLWRSPLGLRINAVDTTGSSQTEDWIRIRGDQLKPHDGAYDVRITAELWETHYFDHVSLLVVDHPAGTEMVVDERFARQAPRLEAQLITPPRPVASAHDEAGNDLTTLVAARDGRHAAGFVRGRYQGIAAEHAIEMDLGSGAPASGPLLLVASGWVYPTDSSINLAIAQGSQPAPHGLAVDSQDAAGVWVPLIEDAGFPSGKNKTILIDLSRRPAGSRRIRLRTNMEIYWDALGWATPITTSPAAASPVIAPVPQQRVAASDVTLRYRGFSQTIEDRDMHAPEMPQYGRVEAVSPRWRDLTGFHTRFGDVTELLRDVDDRYVIMNAGDEMRLRFPAPAPPPAGWVRDFVLIGDGWEKDGDFNTGYSKTVLPLPQHGVAQYAAASPDLESDPVYQQHRDDWVRFHTRYVSPDSYLRGLRGAH